MRIVQLIDSLASGGAERMAVNYTNAIGRRGFSALVTTREQGPLLNAIEKNVVYAHLNKRKTVDLKALSAFRSFCQENRIDVVHAHGTSFFFAVMLKLSMSNIRVVWHDHFGHRDQQKISGNVVLWICARFFWGAIVVNSRLADWAKSKLGLKRVCYFPNFTTFSESNDGPKIGGADGKRIVCIANLREPKNHHLIVNAAAVISKEFPEWTFHFVGKDYSDLYSSSLKDLIAQLHVAHCVLIHGQRTDIKQILDACEIGVIASDYEGLPVALLEYGLCAKAVVSTAVGEIPQIISNGENGFLIEPNSSGQLVEALKKLISDSALRSQFGKKLKNTIAANHSENAVIDAYFKWLDKDTF